MAKLKFNERIKRVRGIVIYLGLFTGFLGWASYQTFTLPKLKPGTVFLGVLLGVGAFWNAYLFGMSLVAFRKMKRPTKL